MSGYRFNGMDIQVEDTQSTAGKFVLYLMLGVFALASAWTTFSFFMTYAPRLGTSIHPAYGPYIAGALGVVLFDLAGLGWTVLRARNSDTSRQFVIATTAAVITIALALTVSALQVLFSASLDVGMYGADGALTQFGSIMHGFSVVVMTAGFVVNFGAITAYVNSSKDVSQAIQNTQLRAYMASGQFAADRARAQLVTEQTLEQIMRQLPSLAATAGQHNAAGYVDASFAGITPSATQPQRVTLAEMQARIDEARAGGTGDGPAAYSNGAGNGANPTMRLDGR
jgi:hypothetical protein